MLLRIGSIVLNLAAVALITIKGEDEILVTFNDTLVNHGHTTRSTERFVGAEAKALKAWLEAEAEDVTNPPKKIAAMLLGDVMREFRTDKTQPPVQQQRTPVIGDTVTFVIACDDAIRSVCPATVTTVWSDTCVNLKLNPTSDIHRDVIDALPQADEPTSVNYDNVNRADRTWHWPDNPPTGDSGASA